MFLAAGWRVFKLPLFSIRHGNIHQPPLMKRSDSRKLLVVNAAYWLVAMLIHPVLHLLPTASGRPAKIFELLVPLFFIFLAAGSTYLLKTALGKTREG